MDTSFKSSKAPLEYVFFIKTKLKQSYTQMFMTRSLFRNKWEQKHRVLYAYINNKYAMPML